MTVMIDLPKLDIGQSILVDVNGTGVLGRVLIVKSQNGWHALNPICPHQRKSLENSRIKRTDLLCPHHGARFCLLTGAAKTTLTKKPLTLYGCEERDGKLQITLKPKENK